jgi:hypothetical protein
MYADDNPTPLLDIGDDAVFLTDEEVASVMAKLRNYLRQLANAWGPRTGP